MTRDCFPVQVLLKQYVFFKTPANFLYPSPYPQRNPQQLVVETPPLCGDLLHASTLDPQRSITTKEVNYPQMSSLVPSLVLYCR